MVVSGVPRRNGLRHAHQIACMSLELVRECRRFLIPHKPEQPLVIRVGLHSGRLHVFFCSSCELVHRTGMYMIWECEFSTPMFDAEKCVRKHPWSQAHVHVCRSFKVCCNLGIVFLCDQS